MAARVALDAEVAFRTNPRRIFNRQFPERSAAAHTGMLRTGADMWNVDSVTAMCEAKTSGSRCGAEKCRDLPDSVPYVRTRCADTGGHGRLASLGALPHTVSSRVIDDRAVILCMDSQESSRALAFAEGPAQRFGIAIRALRDGTSSEGFTASRTAAEWNFR